MHIAGQLLIQPESGEVMFRPAGFSGGAAGEFSVPPPEVGQATLDETVEALRTVLTGQGYAEEL